MTKESLISKAQSIYFEEGVSTLMTQSWSYFKNQIYNYYVSIIRRIHQDVPCELKHISLNGVTVPVEVYPIDKYIPCYTPPYHTEDYPMYENVEVEALRTFASKGDEVVVIGGGLGVTSVVAHRVTGGPITVYEPNQERCKISERTFRINDCGSNIDLHCALVSESSLEAINNGIQCIPPNELSNADLFEIDCEGAETEILKNMDVRPAIILVETHGNHDDVVSILVDIGYEIVEVVENGTEQHSNCTHIRARNK